MAAYTQFGYGGYPSASQLLSSNVVQSQSPQTGDTPTAQSTISAANAPTLSPSSGGECRTQATAGDASTGALSPDGISQHSNAPLAGGAPPLGGAPGGGEPGSLSVHHVVPTAGGSCCENGRPIMTDPVSGQTVCSCQYDSARLALSSYSRLPAASVGVYGTPYPSTDQNPYQSIGVDSSAFYTPLTNPYTLKDSTTGTEMTAWTSAGLQPTTGYYSYDPMGAYGYGASYDLAARRKNATRESTATLKAWLNEHKKNPYPTKGEKIMLAIITKMTLTQVSTWFANARRRLKKENKMTWEPKNRTDDDDDAVVSDDEKDKEDNEVEKGMQVGAPMHGGNAGLGSGASGNGMSDGLTVLDQRKDSEKDEDDLVDDEQKPLHSNDMRGPGLGFPGVGYHGGVVSNHSHGYHPYHHQHPAYYQHQQAMLAASYHAGSNNINKNEHSDSKNQLSRDCGVPIPASKPKIWSLADTVACKTPPPTAYMGQPQQQQQQPQHHMDHSSMSMPLQQQQQPQHMMSSSGAMPYSRAPTTAYGAFQGATAQQLHTMNRMPLYSNLNSSSNNNNGHNNSNSSSSQSSHSNSGTHTPTTPTTANPLAQLQQQQHQLQQQALRHATNPRAMVGFPEAQPDTPPQTPPNMKVPSMAANLLLTASQAPTTGTCRSSNACYTSAVPYAVRCTDYSPRDESSSGSSSCSGGASPMLPHAGEATFKPLFKRQQLTTIAGFVPPV